MTTATTFKDQQQAPSPPTIMTTAIAGDPQRPGELDGFPKHKGTPLPGRIWVDGCFDFFHHGHAGAMVQARQLGDALYVGVHSDAAITHNKGPPVMSERERFGAAAACRWVSHVVCSSPYVTQLDWIDHYGCGTVVHGDDITSDSDGGDCYRFVKEAGRFRVVRRTPGISTTDLVGRILLVSKGHFIRDLRALLGWDEAKEGDGDNEEARALRDRLVLYATDETAKRPGVDVWTWRAGFVDKIPISALSAASRHVNASNNPSTNLSSSTSSSFEPVVRGLTPKPGQRIVYVDGGFDLFSMGHISFLQKVHATEVELARQNGWFDAANVQQRQRNNDGGADYPPAYVVAGIHDDEVINHVKKLNFPIMNIYERGLCLLQCRYVNSVIFSAPFSPGEAYLKSLPCGTPDVVCHGATDFMGLAQPQQCPGPAAAEAAEGGHRNKNDCNNADTDHELDPYEAPRRMGIYQQLAPHGDEGINAETIVKRIMANREQYIARQEAKTRKARNEEKFKKMEMEKERKAAGASE